MHSLTRREWLCVTRTASFKGWLWLRKVGVEGVRFFLTAIGVYAFLKLLVEVVMLLLFLLFYYAGGCVGFNFYVGGKVQKDFAFLMLV